MLTAADRATELARAVDDERILADAKLRQGTALIALGRMNEAQGALEEAAQLMERLGVVRVLPGTLANLGVTYLVLGEFERTRRLSERALRLAEQVGELWQIAFTPVDLSEVLFYLGHWIAARRYTERAAGVVEGSDPAWYTAYPSLFLAIVDLAEGSWEDGDRHMAACLSIARQEEDLQALRAAHRWLAERDLIQGRAEDAPARLQPLLDRPGLQEEQVTRILPCLGSAYLELGDMRRAEETLVKGLGRARRQNHRLALVDLLRVQGVLRSRQSRWEEAEQAFREAMSLARSMSYPYAQARALYERGWMYGRKGDPAPAQEWLEEALQIFRRLGARPYVHLTEEALALPR
jgi:tetratricopeptide (TPR) repeat protein